VCYVIIKGNKKGLQLRSFLSVSIRIKWRYVKSTTYTQCFYYGKCAGLLSERALRPPQTLLAKILGIRTRRLLP